MKRMTALLGVLVVSAGLVIPVASATAQSAAANLIANPGFETASGASPAGWTKNSWGTHTSSFKYEPTGKSGSRAASVTISGYKSGDAKWYAAPVAVTPGAKYEFSNWYKSTAVTGVDAVVVSTSGQTSYLHLADPVASADWRQQTVGFTAPVDAKTVTIYHYIETNGSLTVDDYVLVLAGSASTPTPTPTPTPNPTPSPTPAPTPSPTPAPGGNLVTNPSAELASNGRPTGWTSNAWGSNTSSFSYETNGHDGSRSLKATVSSYSNGDAKWYFTPISVTPGATYTYSQWYKADVQTEVDAMVTMNDGSIQYYYLGAPSASGNWANASYRFVVPSNAKNLTFFHVVSKKGYVQIDNVSVTRYDPVQLDRGLVSLTFDDGWSNIHANALPLLKKYGLPSTQYLNSQPTMDSYTGYMTYAMINDFKAQGSELAWHTRTHADVTKLNASQLNTELSIPQAFLNGTGMSASGFRNFASPYGAYNASAVGAIMSMYQSHRSTDVGYNSKDSLDLKNIKVQNITRTTTPADVQSWLFQAAANKSWLVLVYHEVSDTPSDSTYAVTPSNLDQELRMVQQSGLAVRTVDQAIAEIRAQ